MLYPIVNYAQNVNEVQVGTPSCRGRELFSEDVFPYLNPH